MVRFANNPFGFAICATLAVLACNAKPDGGRAQDATQCKVCGSIDAARIGTLSSDTARCHDTAVTKANSSMRPILEEAQENN